MLRKIAALSICLVGLASAALADGPGARYGRACCQFSWTGFYVGANVGVLWDDSSHTLSPSGSFLTDPATVPTNSLITRTGDLDATSLTGGVQVGYNHQMGMLVVGIESDFNGAGSRANDSAVTSLPAPLAGTMTHRRGREARLVRHAARLAWASPMPGGSSMPPAAGRSAT